MEPSRTDNDLVRVVLFGRPEAGKSSLLGALVEASQNQPEVLGWRLQNLPEGMAEIQARLYGNQPRRTTQEIVPFQVTFVPASSSTAAQPQEALLVDSDGQAAIELLESAEALQQPRSEPSLANELLNADCVIVVLPAEPMEVDFTPLDQFLRLLEEQRGQRSDLSGLPVYLVLSKCDLLGSATMSAEAWHDRIEQKEADLEERLEHFRSDQSPAFGKIEVHTAATAVRQPALADTPAQPRSPFGVAELFRDSLEHAARYRQRYRRSNFLMIALLTMVASVLTAMAALAGIMFMQPRVYDTAAQERIFQQAVQQEEARFARWSTRGQDLATFADYSLGEGLPVPWKDWQQRVEKLLVEADTPPNLPPDRLPGGGGMTYKSVFATEAVVRARDEWQETRTRLERLRDLVAALGMGESTVARPALLRIPPPPDFTAARSAPLLESFRKIYPDASWSLDHLPDKVARELRAVAALSSRNLLRAGQDEVLRQLLKRCPDGRETPLAWRGVRDWLAETTELNDWKELWRILSGLHDPRAGDPVAVLHKFLDQDRFVLELQKFSLTVPKKHSLAADGNLTVYHGVGEDIRAALRFKVQGKSEPDASGEAIVYSLVPEAGEALTYRLNYLPGDSLWAEMPVKEDAKLLQLTWSRCRSAIFKFERLLREPALHARERPAGPGDVVESIVLKLMEGSVPRVPDLLPVVKGP